MRISVDLPNTKTIKTKSLLIIGALFLVTGIIPVNPAQAHGTIPSVCLPTIDFETDASGNPLAAGTIIDDEYASYGLNISTNVPNRTPAMIFDSSAPTGGDDDLGTPNQDFGGPGIGDGGKSGMPGENNQSHGKILIISEDGDQSDPDDNQYPDNALRFNFDEPVYIDYLIILDIDDNETGGNVKAFDQPTNGTLQKEASILALGDNSFQKVTLNTSGVRYLKVNLVGSGAVAKIVSCESLKPQVDVELKKTVDNDSVNVGEAFTFEVTVKNHGPKDATNTEVSDSLPTDLQFISATSTSGTYDHVSGTWQLGTLVKDQQEKLFITATASTTGEYTNEAEVSITEPETDYKNNKDSAKVKVDKPTTPPPSQDKIDLSVKKSASPGQDFVGENFTFTVTASNSSTIDVTGVTVTDIWPAGLEFVSATSTLGTYSTTTNIWTIGDMLAHATSTLTLVARGTTLGTFTNVVTITGNKQETDLSNNQASSTVKVIEPDRGGPPGGGGGGGSASGGGGSSSGGGGGSTVIKTADVGVEKSASVSEVNELNNFTFKLTATNYGPDTATNVVVTDALPSGLQFISASSTSGGSYIASTGTWSIGTLAKDAISILFIEVKTLEGTASSTIINIASINASEPDPNAANNQDDAQVHVRAKEVRGEEDKPTLPVTGIPINPWSILILVIGIGLTIIEGFWHGFKRDKK